jgi:plasmid segregation protein ParM
MIYGIDAGASFVKAVSVDSVKKFNSMICPYRELRMTNGDNLDEGSYIIEFRGEKFFAGNIAERESIGGRKPGGISKAHNETLLRVLLYLHQFGSATSKIAVGQPIEGMVEEEKNRIKDMLKGKHEFTVNGETKTLKIEEVAIVPECAAGFYSLEDRPEGTVNTIDAGSTTINYCQVMNDFFIDKASGTLNYGTETNKSINIKNMAESIIAETRNTWNKHDQVFVCGGVAEQILPHLKEHFENISLIQNTKYYTHGVRNYSPQFSNAFGLYNIAKAVFS